MLPTKFRLIWPSGFRGGYLKKLANQIQKLPVVPIVGNGSSQNVHSLERSFHKCFLLSFSSLVQLFQRSRLKYEKLTDGRRTDAK
jgi:hypothetical protein